MTVPESVEGYIARLDTFLTACAQASRPGVTIEANDDAEDRHHRVYSPGDEADVSDRRAG